MASRPRLFTQLQLAGTVALAFGASACFEPSNDVAEPTDGDPTGDTDAESTEGVSDGEPLTTSRGETDGPGSAATTSDTDDATTQGETSVDETTTTDETTTDAETGIDDEPVCGDSIVDAGEACDDGNPTNGDGCNVDCIESGTPLSTLRYDSPAHLADVARAVAVGPDGSFVVVGTVDRTDLGQSRNVFVRKYDEDGAVAWTHAADLYGGDDVARGAAVHVDGTIAVNGYVTHPDTGLDVWTMVMDEAGEERWTRTYDSPDGSEDVGHGVGFDADGDVFVGGYTYRGDLSQDRNIWTRRYDGTGGTVWTASYDNVAHSQDRCRAFQVNASGRNLCAGYEYRGDIGHGFDMLALVRDADGNTLWTATFDGAASLEDTAWGGAISASGEVVLCGRTQQSAVAGDFDLWVGMYDASGDLQWSDDEAGGNCEGAAFDADGNVVVAGMVDDDAWVRKYDPDGETLWTRTHDGPEGGANGAIELATWPDGRVVVVGYETFAASGEAENMWIQIYAP